MLHFVVKCILVFFLYIFTKELFNLFMKIDIYTMRNKPKIEAHILAILAFIKPKK